MLHLILGILKIIGILLLVLLGILFLTVTALLFIPLRYEAAGKVKEGAAAGRMKLSWLLRMISVTVGYREGRTHIRIRLFGIPLGRRGGRKRRSSGKSGKRRAEKKQTEKKQAEKKQAEKKGTEQDRTAQKRETSETDVSERNTSERNVSERNVSDAGVSREHSLTETEKEDPSGQEKEGREMPSLLKKIKSVFHTVVRTIGRIWEFILFLPEWLLDLTGRISDIFASGQDAAEKLSRMKAEMAEKIGPYLEPESMALYKRLIGHLKYLWKHYGPRRMEGWLRFGTGAPDLTGWLTGVVYLLLPPSADFKVEPDFTRAVLEADVILKGHIRSCSVARVAFLLWRDKELRKMIRRIKRRKLEMADNFQTTVDSLFKGMENFITTKTVVGDAIHIGDTIILPLIDVTFGVAASAKSEDRKNNGGGGMGGKMSPSAVLVIKDGTAKLVNVKQQDGVTKILDMVPDIVNRFVPGAKGTKDPDENVKKACDEAAGKEENF